SVFVIADQPPLGVGGQGGFPRAGQAEEEGDVPALPDVGGAVHGQNPFFRQQIVHHTEYGLFHFAGVIGASDQDQPPFQADGDKGLGTGSIPLGIRLKAGGDDQRQLRLVFGQLLFGGADQQLPDKEVVPSQLIDHADG